MKMKTLTINGATYQVCDPTAVSVEAQTLSEDEKQQARQNLGIPAEKTYELIEDVTLAEDVPYFSRNTAPDGTAYNFSDLRIVMNPAANPDASYNASAIVRLCCQGNDFMTWHTSRNIIHQNPVPLAFVARNDKGIMEYYSTTGSEVVSLTTNSNYYLSPWKNVIKFVISTYPEGEIIKAGTRVRIYAVRG